MVHSAEGRVYLGILDEDRMPIGVTVNGTKLKPRRDLIDYPRAHASGSQGFAWGYDGSGPLQLAIAILADALADDERALAMHVEFKNRVIIHLSQTDPFTLTHEEIINEIQQLEQAHARQRG